MAQGQRFNVKRAEEADKLHLVRFLNTLIEQEGNALAAHDRILRKLQDADDRHRIRSFREDHARHLDALTAAVTSRGGIPFEPSGPSPVAAFEAMLMERAVADARDVLAHYELMERQSVWLYDAASSADLPADVNAILEEALVDEQKHHASAVNRL